MKNRSLFEFKVTNILLAIGIVVCITLSIASSLLLGQFIDLLGTKPSLDRDTVLYLFTILISLVLAIIADISLAQYLPLRLELKKSMEYSRGVMNGLLNISQKNYRKREKGYYINLVTSSAFTCGDIYGQLNVELVGNMSCVLLMLVVAMSINVYIGLVYLIYIPLFALVTQKPNKKIADFQKSGLPTQDAFLSETKKIVEDKRAINIARAENYYTELYKRRSEQYLSFVSKFKWYSILSTNIPTLLSALLTITTLGIAAVLYFDGVVTIGTTFVVYELSQLLQSPLNRCFEIWIYRSINAVHVERIKDFSEEPNEATGFEEVYSNLGVLVSLSHGSVFSTPEKKRMLFSVDKLSIPKHKLIVIKGGNGTGKSTLTDLLTGFTDIEIFEGQIKLDQALSSASYLSHPILFADGNVKENMFGQKIDPDVLKMLGISFQTKTINESGSNLSFGEQQKLGLLRVLSSDAEVVILDEPFTNLDRDSVERLTAFIANLKGKKSVIAIVHSPELDEFADMTLQIKGEKLVCIDRKADI